MTRARSNASIALGIVLMVVGFVAALVGVSAFAAPNPLPPLLDWICFLCFVGFWLPGGAGLLLLIKGLVGRPPE